MVLDVVEHGVEGLERVAGEADEAGLALFLDLEEGRQGFLPDLRERDEFDVVKEEDVEVVGLQPLQRDVDGFLDAAGGEIEVDVRVAAELGAEEVGLAGHVAQADAEEDLRHAAAVERGGVDEVHPEVEGGAGRAHRLVEGDRAEFRAERGGAEGEDGKVEAGLAEGACFHGKWRRIDWTVAAAAASGSGSGSTSAERKPE